MLQASPDDAQDNITAEPTAQQQERREPLLSDSTGSPDPQPEPEGGVLMLPERLRSAAAVHYPLTSRSLLASWPAGNRGEYQGQAEGPATWVEDDTFGSAMYCIKGRPPPQAPQGCPNMHAWADAAIA